VGIEEVCRGSRGALAKGDLCIAVVTHAKASADSLSWLKRCANPIRKDVESNGTHSAKTLRGISVGRKCLTLPGM
jgi:hypothetical protein